MLSSAALLLQLFLLSSITTAFTAKQFCLNDESSINGTPFPSLIDVTTEDLISGLEVGLFTSADLVKAYTQRILEVNATLHMVTQLNPDASTIAAQLDHERRQGYVRGPLHGIPILIKDNIATADNMSNTAGSYALIGSAVPRDSFIVDLLRRAGAIILGKTNLSQWANFRSFNTSNGWSATAGQTFGAYFLGQDPSGSSAGSGVSSSLGLALACLGTETSGSILSPSQFNNLVGIKPTVGLTARDLVVPISEHQDTVGPMARTVKDAAYLLSAIAGKTSYDNYTSAIPFDVIPDYVAACNFSALRGKRIGVPRNVFDNMPHYSGLPVVTAFNAALDILQSAGAIIVENTNFTGFEELISMDETLTVLQADFVSALPKYLSQLFSNPHKLYDLSDVLNFTQSFPAEDWPERDTLIWEGALNLGYNNTSPQFWEIYTHGLLLAGPMGVTGALKNHSLDALVIPTDYSSFVPALIGTPVITVPLGAYPANTTFTMNDFGNLNATGPNQPFGISFLGDKWTEEMLIGLAYAFEQRTHVRDTIQPYIKPKTEIADIVAQRKIEGKASRRSRSLNIRADEKIAQHSQGERCRFYESIIQMLGGRLAR